MQRGWLKPGTFPAGFLKAGGLDNTKYSWYSCRSEGVPKSGEQVLKLYRRAGWSVFEQKGSHVRVGRGSLRETIPMHKELAIGLERKLMKRLRQAEERTEDQ